jgi:hypothetical protein
VGTGWVIPLQLAIIQAKAQPLAAHRRPTAEEQEGKGSVTTFKDRGQSYLLRRIARDQPQLLDQIGPDKEFHSVRAAASENALS